MSAFAERLRELRREKKVRQLQLGEYLGYGGTAIVNYESGRNEPSFDTLIKLAEYFEVSVGYLVGSEPTPHPCDILSEQEKEWLRAFSKLSAEQKELMLRLLGQMMLEENKQEGGETIENFAKGD